MCRAIVVFHGRHARLWRRALKPGFRHCFAAVLCSGYWVLFDPREGSPELRVLAGRDADLAAFYRQRGFTALETTIREGAFLLPVMPATCVAVVKRLIGLRAALVLTPWQLYRRLFREQHMNLFLDTGRRTGYNSYTGRHATDAGDQSS